MATITCIKQKKVYQVRSGLELLRAYQINPQLPFRFGCCQGQCGTCAIRITEGKCHLSRKTKQEEQTLRSKGLDSDYRLACQCSIEGNISIDI
ncbi:2Fe-2S iron-sulfur cluster-binding protein [Candidatus Protochlamydia phocaeensis]|uniref:2Fe-2S iron-sulfur cluster-binding protein n=1 Tax=Candidatus Protochlamydia phocaeensis TaxID=1414722 RepID=UPI0008395EAC|nr:2Fe-2S iron-sulfur cluster-binding protein [Candidatus Protochlamydia phocaeensis]